MNRLRALLLVALPALLLCSLPPVAVEAQGSAEIVELDDGSFVRGTIVERVEGSHLIVQTATGEVRRVELARVVYAGPVEGRRRRADGTAASQLGSPTSARPPADPYATSTSITPGRARAREVATTRSTSDVDVRVRARGGRTDVVLYEMTNNTTGTVTQPMGLGVANVTLQDFRPICVAPCTAALRRGAYVFGIGRGEQRARRIGGTPVQIEDGMLLDLEYLDRSTERGVGWMLFILGLLGGGAIATVPAFTDAELVPTLVGAVSTFAVLALVGLPLGLLGDGVMLRVFD